MKKTIEYLWNDSSIPTTVSTKSIMSNISSITENLVNGKDTETGRNCTNINLIVPSVGLREMDDFVSPNINSNIETINLEETTETSLTQVLNDENSSDEDDELDLNFSNSWAGEDTTVQQIGNAQPTCVTNSLSTEHVNKQNESSMETNKNKILTACSLQISECTDLCRVVPVSVLGLDKVS